MQPLLAASLSLLPGMGHLAVGKRGKAAALFVVDIGIVCSIILLRSAVGQLLTCFAYLMVMVPAVIETYMLSQGRASSFNDSKAYIMAMLLAGGFLALPLLWQSSVFSRRAKIAWSVVIPALAVLYFSFLGVYGIQLFNYARVRLN